MKSKSHFFEHDMAAHRFQHLILLSQHSKVQIIQTQQFYEKEKGKKKTFTASIFFHILFPVSEMT